MGMDDIFKFGKHKGEQVEDLFDDDPSYLVYLASMDFDFDEEVLEELTKRRLF